MASDITEMPDEELECPCCGKKLLLKWQMAHYSEGGDSAQFLRLAPKDGDKIAFITRRPPKLRKHEFAQLLNPKNHRWVKLDKTVGSIVAHKKTPGAYKNIPKVDANDDR